MLRAASTTAGATPRAGPRGRIRSVSPTTPMAPTAWPAESRIGAAMLDSPSTASSRSRAKPVSRTALSSLRRPAAVRVRWVNLASGSAGRSSTTPARAGARVGLPGAPPRAGRRVGEDRLAERARVRRQLGADLEHLEGGVRAEHVVDDDDRGPVQHADAHGGLRAGGESLGVDQRAGAQLVVVKIGVAEVEE